MYRAAIFKCDVDDKIIKMNNFPSPYKVGRWLEHNKTRVKWRTYFFIDSVIRDGFKDPVVMWANIETKQFQIHPGVNRIQLKSLLPYLNLKCWIVDFNANSHKDYIGEFKNVQPLNLGPKGNRSIDWMSNHRSTAPDQYEFLFKDDLTVTRIPIKDKHLHAKWDYVSRFTGFSCYDENGKYHYDIGTPQSKKDKFKIVRTEGVYQLMLHFFFDFPFRTWDKLYFTRIK